MRTKCLSEPKQGSSTQWYLCEPHFQQTLVLLILHPTLLQCILAIRQTSPCGISVKRWRKVASRAALSAPIGLVKSLHITPARDLAGL